MADITTLPNKVLHGSAKNGAPLSFHVIAPSPLEKNRAMVRFFEAIFAIKSPSTRTSDPPFPLKKPKYVKRKAR